jgi:hypothetical protein
MDLNTHRARGVLLVCALLGAACTDIRAHDLGALREDGGARAEDAGAARCPPPDEAASCGRFSDPVCGCDLVSHASLCDARDAGVGVLHRGFCTPDECREGGRVPVQGDGNQPPQCPRGVFGFPIAGREPALCCD